MEQIIFRSHGLDANLITNSWVIAIPTAVAIAIVAGLVLMCGFTALGYYWWSFTYMCTNGKKVDMEYTTAIAGGQTGMKAACNR